MITNRSGFTLVEMAIVLVIVGLLLSGGMTVLGTQQEMRRINETTAQLNEAKEALIGFALVNRRLPCPAVPSTPTGTAVAGLNAGEERTSCTGANQAGVLPWATLGLSETDAWGHRYSYRVSSVFASTIALSSKGNITVNGSGGVSIATQIPAVIISHGKNGKGARNTSGTILLPMPTATDDEGENTNANSTFVSHPPVGTGGAGGEFDDLVIWLSPNILFNRMVMAQVLPYL